MQSELTDEPALEIRRVQAVVNPASGSVKPGTAAALVALLDELGLEHEVRLVGPGGLGETLRTAIAAAPDLLVVLGGDGTARRAAELCGPAGPLLAPLCGGTMNKLGRAIYGPRPWREVLVGALVGPAAARWVPGGTVGGRAFFCRAVLGSPALFAPAREAIRARKLRHAWRRTRRALKDPFGTRLNFRLEDETGRGPAIALICPTVSRAFAEDEGALEAAVLALPNKRAGVRLALQNLFSDWREHPDVTVRPCVEGRAWAHESIPAMLDGEFFRLGRQADIRFTPHAFRALAPGPVTAESV